MESVSADCPVYIKRESYIVNLRRAFRSRNKLQPKVQAFAQHWLDLWRSIIYLLSKGRAEGLMFPELLIGGCSTWKAGRVKKSASRQSLLWGHGCLPGLILLLISPALDVGIMCQYHSFSANSWLPWGWANISRLSLPVSRGFMFLTSQNALDF